jgi:hypothetical protein
MQLQVQFVPLPDTLYAWLLQSVTRLHERTQLG